MKRNKKFFGGKTATHKASADNPTKPKPSRVAYNIPGEDDLLKLQQKIEKLSKGLDSEGNRVDRKGNTKLLSENEVKAIVRSALRKHWMSCNLKLSYLNMGKVPDYDPNTRTLFTIQCEVCGGWFKEGHIQIDHIEGGLELTSLDKDHLMTYARKLLDPTYKGIQRICLDCHEVKTRSEVSGVSLEQARILIENDALIKSAEKGWLEARGVIPAKTKPARQEQIKEILFKQLE